MIQMSPMCYRIICDTYNLAQLISLFMSQSAHTTTHAHAHALYSTHCEETQDKKKMCSASSSSECRLVELTKRHCVQLQQIHQINKCACVCKIVLYGFSPNETGLFRTLQMIELLERKALAKKV